MTTSPLYPEEYDNKEYNCPPGKPQGPCKALSYPPSVDPTSEPGPPREKPTKKMNLEPKYDASLEPSAPTKDGSMGHISPVDIYRY